MKEKIRELGEINSVLLELNARLVTLMGELMKEEPAKSVREYAELVRVSPSTVTRWLQSGKIRGEKIGDKWIVRESI